MKRLKPIQSANDIPKEFQDTPVARLFEYHNFKAPHKVYNGAELLVGMCMDNRKTLSLPENFAFILRAGGANLRYSEFKVSFAVAVGGVEYIALMGHTQCGMVNLMSKKDQFIDGLCQRAGWDKKDAEEHFSNYAPMFEIVNEVDFILSESKRLSQRYPKVKVAPLMYKVEDNLIYWIEDEGN